MATRQSLISGALALLLAGTLTLLSFRHFYITKEPFDYGRGYAVLGPKSEISPANYDLAVLRKGGMLMNEEVMKNAPNERTPYQEGNNPCWKDEGGALLCLPKLVVLGGFHSGTGGLVHALTRHPQIVSTRSSNCQFWAEDGKTMSDYVAGHKDGVPKLQADPQAVLVEHSQSTFAFYWSAGTKTHMKFIQTVRPCHDNCSRSNPVDADRQKCMETVCLPSARDADEMISNLAGLDYLSDQNVPFLMRAVYGSYVPRLVALARDPIERIHSAFWGHAHYIGKYGESAEGFLAFVQEQTQAFQACSDTYGALRCALMFETLGMREEAVHYHCDQILRGMYSLWVEIWLRFFPRDSFLLLKSEDVFEDMAGTVQRVVQHAGLPPVDKETAHGWASLYTIPRHVKNRVMLPEARQLLHAFYMPYNLRLAKITGEDAYLKWNADQESKIKEAQDALTASLSDPTASSLAAAAEADE